MKRFFAFAMLGLLLNESAASAATVDRIQCRLELNPRSSAKDFFYEQTDPIGIIRYHDNYEWKNGTTQTVSSFGKTIMLGEARKISLGISYNIFYSEVTGEASQRTCSILTYTDEQYPDGVSTVVGNCDYPSVEKGFDPIQAYNPALVSSNGIPMFRSVDLRILSISLPKSTDYQGVYASCEFVDTLE